MKRVNKIIVSMLLLILSLTIIGGCSKDISLAKIQEKYLTICENYTDFFENNQFCVTYNNQKLLNVINSSSDEMIEYSVLKDGENVSQKGSYSIVVNAICLPLKNYNLDSVFGLIENNELVSQKFKKELSNDLNKLQKQLKVLKETKSSLESSFDIQKDENQNAKDFIAIQNLQSYKKELAKTFEILLQYNFNLQEAINKDLILLPEIKEISNSDFEVSNEFNNKLINNASLLISQFILKYYIDIKNDIKFDENNELIENLTKFLLINNTNSKNDDASKQKYKNIRLYENDVKNMNRLFIREINKKEKEIDVKIIQNYEKLLVSYSNSLIEYLEKF